MLKKLYIKNFAIVDELEIDFEPGFQVITGETGAGKSILVGALGLLCGERANSDMIRSGEDKAILEGEFKIEYNAKMVDFFSKVGVDTIENKVILRREMHTKGTSRAFINDTPATVNNLNEISSLLIDLHGQHQHQRLLHSETHIDYLDAYGKINPIFIKYKTAYESYYKLKNNLNDLLATKKNHIEKQSLLRFQLDELEKANLKEYELDELVSERKALENHEILHEITNSVNNLLYSSEDSALIKILESQKKLKQIIDIKAEFQEFFQGLESIRVTIEEIGRFCEGYYSTIEFDPKRLEDIRTRETFLDWLLKKYQVTSITDLIQYKESIIIQLNLIENYDEKIKDINSGLEQSRNALQKLALDISEIRKELAVSFESNIENIFESVGLKNAKFKVQINWKEDQNGVVNFNNKIYSLNECGLDIVEFYIGINLGETARPLQKVASGGEISRIMLCIKSLLADSDEIPTLVFDEIDIGISGRIAQIVGKRMRSIAKNHQLITITHLPQIASQADTHFSVMKKEHEGRTKVDVKKLAEHERVIDIAKLLGGEKISEQVIANAEELLSVAKE